MARQLKKIFFCGLPLKWITVGIEINWIYYKSSLDLDEVRLDSVERLGLGLECTMQSYENSFCGVVVLDNFNKASRERDNIIYQIYKRIPIKQ